MYQLFKSLSHLEKSIKNLYVLNRSSAQIGDVCIVGCTLWSKPLVKVPNFIVSVHEMNTRVYKRAYEKDLAYIEKMIAYSKRKNCKLLVVTHHCPTYSVITSNKKKKDKYISLYASQLDHLLTKNNVNTWVCGHIHINFDIVTDGGTHLVGNQRGKPKDHITDYNKKLVISI